MPAVKRPPAVWTTAALLVFLGVTAAGGGVAMLAGGGAAPPDEWLDAIPLIQDWRLPGLVLLIGFGAGSLVTAYGVLRRRRCRWLGPVERLTGQHWSWLATTLLGLGQVVWIALELAYLPQLSFLQPCYALVGLVLLLLPLHPQVRAYLARSGRATLPPTRGRAQAPEERQPVEEGNRDEDLDGGRRDDPGGGVGGPGCLLPEHGGSAHRAAIQRPPGD